MATGTREALLVSLPATESEHALDAVLAERGFERADLPPPSEFGSILRTETRFFDVDEIQPTLSVMREWMDYGDATAWGAALDLAEGLPPAARMEMALPPALAVLARGLSRRTPVLGFASRDKPWHLVGVAFRDGRAIDVITAVKDRVAIGPGAQSQPGTRNDMRSHLDRWLAPYAVNPLAIDILLGERDLPSAWRLGYLHG
ncbi:MAG: hypothetical protein ACT4PJ_16650 [Gemmatimonadaceae bacterium]